MIDAGKAPWEKIKLTPTQEGNAYQDFGNHYIHMSLFRTAEKTLTHALQKRPESVGTLEKRSNCRRNLAKIEEALSDLRRCDVMKPNNGKISRGIDSLLYDLNRLEDAYVALHNDARKFDGGHEQAAFDFSLTVLTENFKDSLGRSLSPFIMKHEKTFKIVAEIYAKEQIIDERPMWKRLRDEQKCDVQSIPDIEPEILSPRELARRELAFRVYLQTYLNKSWRDVIFLRKLLKNPNFLLTTTPISTPELRSGVCETNASILKFLKMLQTRSPLYNEHRRKCPKPGLCESQKEKLLNVIQYQTRRRMIKILRAVCEYRKIGDIKKVAQLVENVMGDYVVLKTSRTMPWKFEFLNEMYNILGLTHTDRFIIPENLHTISESKRLKVLLHLPIDKLFNIREFEFGRKSTFYEPDAIDPVFERYKTYIERIRKRLIHVKYPIEKSYLFFELSRVHNKQGYYEDSVPLARKGIDAAKECNNYLWQFLGMMEIIKARAAVNKIEYLRDALKESEPIVKKLNSERMEKYLELANQLNEESIANKVQPISNVKSKKSHMSMRSVSSIYLPDL